jgi:hypothetical protein
MTQDEIIFDNRVARLGSSLVDVFPQFRRIWVQYNRPSKRFEVYNVVVTLFPPSGTYHMLFGQGLQGITLDNVSTLIQNHLENTD